MRPLGGGKNGCQCSDGREQLYIPVQKTLPNVFFNLQAVAAAQAACTTGGQVKDRKRLVKSTEHKSTSGIKKKEVPLSRFHHPVHYAG